MATVHAGTKRSFEQMRDRPLNASHHFSAPQSREQSPPSRPSSRLAHAASEHLPASNVPLQIDHRPRRANFAPSASIVLVGLRGTGKSSLAVIAAAAYNYRLIESQRAFVDSVGISPADYRAKHGVRAFQRRNSDILERTLQLHAERAVIVCSFSDLEDDGASLLQKYAQDHPVVHIARDASALHDYFKTWSLDRINQLLLASGSILRACSNFEFFNVSQAQSTQSNLDHQPIHKRDRESQGKYLTLKQVERDFLRLLRNVVGDHGRSIAHHSAYPLSQLEVERRPHTLAACLDSYDVTDGKVDLEAVQIGVDCVKLLVHLDDMQTQKGLYEASQSFAVVRRNSILPIWIAIVMDRGDDQEEALFQAVSFCLKLGPELCMVDAAMEDATICDLVANRGSTRLVANCSMPTRPAKGWKDESCAETYRRAAMFGFSLVEITMPAESAESSFEPATFCAEMRRQNLPTGIIAYDTGGHGRTSQCFNDVLTSVNPPTYARTSYASHGVSEAITARSITEALFASFVLEPLRFYIYGRDVSYSLSPAMANAAYAACGMKHELTTFQCADLEGFRKLVHDPDFGGSAILQPFKRAVMPMLDGVSSHARAIGAVNTVIPIHKLADGGAIPDDLELIRQRNRRGPLQGLYGTNTDWIGIRSCLRRGLSPANSVRPASTGLVCGAGGMARAAVHSLASLGCQNIFVCNRSAANAHDIAQHYNRLIARGDIPELGTSATGQTRVRVIESFADDWPRGFRPPTMLACCIPADTADGTPIDFTLPPAWLRSPTGGVVVEIAYKRPLTPLIEQIRALADRGWVLYDGFDVLPEQAYAQFEVFTGRRAPRKLMKDQVLKHYNAMTATAQGAGE